MSRYNENHVFHFQLEHIQLHHFFLISKNEKNVAYFTITCPFTYPFGSNIATFWANALENTPLETLLAFFETDQGIIDSNM